LDSRRCARGGARDRFDAQSFAGLGELTAVMEVLDGLFEADGDEQADDDGGDVEEEVAPGVGGGVGWVDVEHKTEDRGGREICGVEGSCKPTSQRRDVGHTALAGGLGVGHLAARLVWSGDFLGLFQSRTCRREASRCESVSDGELVGVLLTAFPSDGRKQLGPGGRGRKVGMVVIQVPELYAEAEVGLDAVFGEDDFLVDLGGGEVGWIGVKVGIVAGHVDGPPKLSRGLTGLRELLVDVLVIGDFLAGHQGGDAGLLGCEPC
jgi:hypothetical protein